MQKLLVENSTSTRRLATPALLTITLSVVLTGCLSLPRDRGVTAVDALVTQRSSSESVGAALLPQAASQREQLQSMLAEPLDAEGAVRVALLGNVGMQSLYAQLGLTQAAVYDATRLANPSLGFMQMGGEGTRTTWSITQPFTQAVFIGYHRAQGKNALLQAQLKVAQAVLNLESDVRRSYYRYVTAALIAQLHEQTTLTAQASMLYAQDLYRAGSVSELQVSRERAAASEAKLAWQAAQNELSQRRSELLTLLGVTQSSVQFNDRLDVPVKQTLDAESLYTWADQQRLDLQLLREQNNTLAQQQTHVRRWFWLDDASLSAERETDSGVSRTGIGGSVGLPLFNQGGGARLRAQSELELSQADLQQLQLSLRNDLNAQLDILERSRLAVEEYRDTLVPLRERVLELTQQQQNFMLIGAFDLLNTKRELLNTYQAFLQATGDYWVQQVSLQQLVGGKLPASAGDASYGISVGVDALPEAENDLPTAKNEEGAAASAATATSTDSSSSSSHDAHNHSEHQP